MNNTTTSNCIFPISDFEQVKRQMLNWAQQFSIFCFLDNHQYQIAPHTMECMLAAGCKRKITSSEKDGLLALQGFIDNQSSWLFGHLGYDLKNTVTPSVFTKQDLICFPDFFFFEPEIIVRLGENEISIDAENADEIFLSISNAGSFIHDNKEETVTIQSRISKEEYLAVIDRLRAHILRGDCYEINFCQEFFAEQAFIEPIAIYQKLSDASPNPFSALYKLDDKYLICASPERFLKKQGHHILSQPIKGTSKRTEGGEIEDEINKSNLYHSEKDRSENVMVVDLVRNDLSIICSEGSVVVDELYGIYSFPQVYQMISTISGQLKEDISFTEIIKATFPMGSMTGAPKKSVMQLIEKYEKTKRGIFSGALGYITPAGDFDFNVVIRSIMYNASSKYLSFQAGSGITFYSNPENEWEECLLKAEAMRRVLEGTSNTAQT